MCCIPSRDFTSFSSRLTIATTSRSSGQCVSAKRLLGEAVRCRPARSPRLPHADAALDAAAGRAAAQPREERLAAVGSRAEAPPPRAPPPPAPRTPPRCSPAPRRPGSLRATRPAPAPASGLARRAPARAPRSTRVALAALGQLAVELDRVGRRAELHRGGHRAAAPASPRGSTGAGGCSASSRFPQYFTSAMFGCATRGRLHRGGS